VARLGKISGKEAAQAFKKAGWEPIGQVGRHLIMTKTDIKVNLPISQHKKLSIGTLRALIPNANLTVEEFLNLL
jgi:predicted RNA binding protein YcfA (HicA-like mRNA interferase family)